MYTLLGLPPSGMASCSVFDRDRMLRQQQPKSRKRERKAKRGETEGVREGGGDETHHDGLGPAREVSRERGL